MKRLSLSARQEKYRLNHAPHLSAKLPRLSTSCYRMLPRDSSCDESNVPIADIEEKIKVINCIFMKM
jgi:hypothetical protein